MITLTTEQAQQIEEALMKIADLRNLGKICPEAIAFETLYIIRAARAQADHSGEFTEMVAEQAEQEPVAWLVDAIPIEGKPSATVGFPFATSSKETVDACIDGIHIVTPLYAAPVRTKDLTKEEIQNAMMPIEPTGKDYFLHFARAVIAADREKNK